MNWTVAMTFYLHLVYRTEGYKGLFRGSLLTLARDVPAFCSYFATYETLRGLVKGEEGKMTLLETAVIGGVSGVVGWAVEIPADNVKNRHQVCLGRRPLSETLREIWSQGGVRQLYRGAGVILVRAFPANAATFIAYEWTIRGLVSLDCTIGPLLARWQWFMNNYSTLCEHYETWQNSDDIYNILCIILLWHWWTLQTDNSSTATPGVCWCCHTIIVILLHVCHLALVHTPSYYTGF